MTSDWTCKDSEVNSSDEFNELARIISRLIRDSASLLLSGGVDGVSRLILAQLTHVHGLVPTDWIVEQAAKAVEIHSVGTEEDVWYRVIKRAAASVRNLKRGIL